MAVTVSSDMALLGGPLVPDVPLPVALLLLLLLLQPGNRWIKSLMAYLPGGNNTSVKCYSLHILSVYRQFRHREKVAVKNGPSIFVFVNNGRNASGRSLF